ncbi:hypothetical protein MC885_013182 [Smutsia gigantea]|nr:hypothetical protein MC885_013182 [Smutsia gigantea]
MSSELAQDPCSSVARNVTALENLSWEGEEEEDDDDDDSDEDDVDVSLEETSPQQVKRPAPQKQTSIAKKKRVENEEEAARPSLKDKSLERNAKPTSKPKKLESKK